MTHTDKTIINKAVTAGTMALFVLTTLFVVIDSLQAHTESFETLRPTHGHSLPTDSLHLQMPQLTAEDTARARQVLPHSFRHTAPNLVNRPEALQRFYEMLTRGERPVRILQLGDSHVAAKSFPNAVRDALQKAWGRAESDSTGRGISYDYMARNGATIHKFLTAERLALISRKQPDLIILSFGTNEAHGMGYCEAQHDEELTAALNALREACPEATLLLTTPPGDYLSRRHVSYRRSRGRRRRVVRYTSQPNPMSMRCAALIDSVGRQQNLAVWDLNTIAGGEVAVRNYVADGLMNADRVHFTPQGYTLHGQWLAQALITALGNGRPE